MFLSGTSPSLQPSVKNSLLANCHRRKDTDPNFNATCNGNMSEVKNFKDSGKDAECVIDVEDEQSSGRMDDVSCGQDRTTGTGRTWSSPNFGALKILIADEYEDRRQIRSGIESTPKEIGSKPFFCKQRCGELPQVKGAFNLFNQRFGWVSELQRHLRSPVHLQFSCSLQLTLALMIAIFLIGEFFLYLNLGLLITNAFCTLFKLRATGCYVLLIKTRCWIYLRRLGNPFKGEDCDSESLPSCFQDLGARRSFPLKLNWSLLGQKLDIILDFLATHAVNALIES
ncbi:hypothetical protein CRYUN_Cryun25bG0035800 [Craigia yunnanensis]